MPQLDVFIFFSQYFILVFSFLCFYIFIVKFLVKETDFVEQMGKYKLVSILNHVAIIRMIIEKLNKKIKNFSINTIQMKKHLNKSFLFEIIVNNYLYRKYATFFLTNIKMKIKKQTLKFINYINK